MSTNRIYTFLFKNRSSKVPRITASSTSNFPLSADVNLSPFTPGAKSLVFISVEFISNPPISPSIAFIPNLLDAKLPKAAFSVVPSKTFITAFEFDPPVVSIVIPLFGDESGVPLSKLNNSVDVIVNPPIVPCDAVSVPSSSTLNGESWPNAIPSAPMWIPFWLSVRLAAVIVPVSITWPELDKVKLLELISKLPLEPLI